MGESHVARHVVVHGRVQGVCFRAFTRGEAERLGVSGWVRNVADGSVEAVFEGPPAAVEALIERVHEGPPWARVARVDVREREPEGRFSRFEVRR